MLNYDASVLLSLKNVIDAVQSKDNLGLIQIWSLRRRMTMRQWECRDVSMTRHDTCQATSCLLKWNLSFGDYDFHAW